jgi:signal transduction histidine kinase
MTMDKLEKKQIDEMLGILVHDINNLLAIVKGYLDLMAAEKDELPESIREGVMVARKASEDISSVLLDIIDIEKMEEKGLALLPKNTDINSLVSGIIEKLRPVAMDSGLELTAEFKKEALTWNVDNVLISRILANLVSGAIRSTRSGGRISVIADCDERALKITVKDTGFPIPPEYRQKIFEKYAQPEIRKANLRRGKGLNLTFCKMAVELHGGRIWVEAQTQQEGSSFIFTIPVK